jgi:hypothetical protein
MAEEKKPQVFFFDFTPSLLSSLVAASSAIATATGSGVGRGGGMIPLSFAGLQGLQGLQSLQDIMTEYNTNTDSQYNEDNIMIVKDYLTTIVRAPVIREELIDFAIDLWIRKKDFPTIDDMVAEYLRGPHAGCIHTYTRMPGAYELYKKMIAHALVEFGGFVPCSYYGIFVEFYSIEKKLPSVEEFKTYFENYLRLNGRDPNEDEHKKSPTKNLDRLVLKEYKAPAGDDSGASCAMCQEQIKDGEKCYTLPCGHSFHPESDSCPSIKRWLVENNKCPMCRKEVEL